MNVQAADLDVGNARFNGGNHSPRFVVDNKVFHHSRGNVGQAVAQNIRLEDLSGK